MKIIKPSIELMDEIDGLEVLKKIERIGRVCYKSEDRISDGSAIVFVRNIIKSGHESVLEHVSITVKVICDRGVSHEIVRHRIASYTQESTRYCVAGDMKLKTSNPHNSITISDLYENKKNSKNGSWKRMRFKQYNERTGEFQFANIRDVFYMGNKNCIRLKTKLGYLIDCTADHEILTTNGYIQSSDIKIGDRIYVNGTKELYANKDWLYNQSVTLNKTFVQISEEFGFNKSTIKKWARKFNIPKKGSGYFNVGRTPWNKGITDERQVEALRKYHHCGRRKDKIIKYDTCEYYKRKGDHCSICGTNENLEVHHIDKNHNNNVPDNLMTLCSSCHQRVHHQSLETAYADEVVSIEEIGEKPVYDISMSSEFHNFVANGVIVHNCNYGNGKFNGEITVVEPCFACEGTFPYARWKMALQSAENVYMNMIEHGATPQEARSVLPNSLKTELVMTMNLREWRHFLKLRTAQNAHPQMREVAGMILKEFKDKMPVIFEDIT